MDLNQKLMSAFQIEHIEHLEGIRSMLAKLGQSSGDSDGSELEEAFRCAHSLKGAARIIGLPIVETLSHRLESLFCRIRGSTAELEKETLTVVHLTLDAIEDAAAASFRGETSETPRRVMEELDRLLSVESTPEGAKPIAKQPAARPRPAPEEPKPHGASRLVDSVRLSAESLDRLLQSSAQLLTASLQQEVVARELQALAADIAGLQKHRESTKRTAAEHRRLNGRFKIRDRVDPRGELVDQQFHSISRRARALAQLQQRNSWSDRLLAEQLREDVRRARMVPAESLFQGFRKMMRDLAHDENKDLEFRMNGMETEADRAVLQALKDPLMHVLRNAVSHGIEIPQQRIAAGKPSQGQIALHIEAVGNRLIVSVEDDGRGIDVGQVSQAAARQGLGSNDGRDWTAAELQKLLIRPGFSTCETVTELSGRGLGLSIANETAVRLQGQITVRAREGGGTVVSLAVPMAVSTHRLLLISCQGQTFGIPLAGIETILRINPHSVEGLEGRPMISHAGQLAPIMSLASLLELAGADVSLQADNLLLIMLKSGSRRVAVAVDDLLLERNAVIQRVGPPAAQSAYFSGGIIQEDGTIALVLDPAELIERSNSSHASIGFNRSPDVEKQSPTILVVDDSVTTRTLETSILQSHGYQVRVAVDGLEALDRLRAEHVDLVISDIQMPRLDGFGLLEEIKKDSQLAAIPVIIVSSMDSRDDQSRGLRLGADAYIVKRNFDHNELLETIQQIV